jgi:ParB family chromosome partitioning protein
LRCLIEKYGLTQQETAEKIGKTQSAVANKLRLLKLSLDTVKLIRERGLSERHARTLLRLDEEQQFFAAEIMSVEKMNVQQAEEYVDNLLLERVKTDKTPQKEGKKRKNPIVFVKDLRIFNNSLMRSIEIMRSSGLDVKYKREQKDGLTVYTVTVPDGVKGPKNVSRETL